ncbi:MAG TPA: DNA translocase FtsK [Verrucomicrobiae bacterium]|jgi:S-DNA-T family DNA segregation ATPase FtsK/SpoIIIE|nr:DNA translocase FtsK [Verrucomicrobiae bacterium]
MPRKDASKSQPHGLNDVIGIVLGAAALLLLVALLSYDPHDSALNLVPPNNPPRNLGGPLGAWVALKLFRVFGIGAFMIPVLLLLFGLGYIFEFLAYLQRRWVWGVVLLLCCMGLASMFERDLGLLQRLQVALNAPSVGGFVGQFLYRDVLRYVGKVGATIVLGAVYVISLIYLTNFKLGHWCRQLWSNRAGAEPAANDKELDRRARDLEKQAKKLQEQLDKSGKGPGKGTEPSGLGPDLRPVPEPTVRDLSVPQTKPGDRGKKAVTELPKEPAPADEGMVIPAKEVAAATTADILGKAAEPAVPQEEHVVAAEGTAPSPAQSEVEPEPVARPKPVPRKPKPIAVAATPKIGNYRLPPLDFLQYPDATAKPTESKEELMANARLMQQTLAQFDIEVALGDITKGPTITRYELHPAPGVKLEKIAGLSNNIAAALKAERINILAPVPGKSSVGVEVPNLIKTKVIMRDIFESEEWRTTKARIPLSLGKDVYGLPIVADLAEMPHLLIAGSTGSGKSVCINSIIASLLYRFPPDQLRFVMIDPKVVELQQYNALPHLVVPVVTDPKKVILALRWVVNEMEKRYQIFARVGVRNIRSFNERPKNKPIPKSEPELPLMSRKEKVEANSDGFAVELDEEIVVPRDEEIVIPDHLSYIVVIIDELADLMLVAPADVEMAIARITQMARAAGIHCIVATQRPSVDVITGVIKANIPARIAFQVAAKVDSRTILDAMGADKLLGKGDMLYLPPGSAKLIRVQGALITDSELQSIVDFIAKQGKPSYEVEIHQQLQKVSAGGDVEAGASGEDEDLIQQCIEVIRSEQKASVSLMQRRLRLGYTRAARIMDELELRGIVGPSKGAEPRDILIDLDGGGADGNPAGGEAAA